MSMTKWTRDLSVVKADGVEAAMAASIPKRPTDQEIEDAPDEPIKRKDGSYVPGHRRELEAHRDAHDQVDAQTRAACEAMAKAGVEVMGGEAHVHMMGADRLDGDATSGHAGSRLLVATVTITKVLPR
jgi:hypothetical protein